MAVEGYEALFINERTDVARPHAYPAAIIRAVFARKAEGLDLTLEVLEPPEISESWPTVNPRFMREVSDEYGPARTLTEDEWAQIEHATGGADTAAES